MVVQIRQLQKRALNLDPDLVFAICIAKLWYQYDAFAMDAIAVNPFYKSGNLGISDQWLQIGRKRMSSGKFLLMYPCDAAETIIQSFE